jgi:outer membrane protein OmpA-like peptidoglycan-associated protein/tetratricopeptide (TPR) repeat protein
MHSPVILLLILNLTAFAQTEAETHCRTGLEALHRGDGLEALLEFEDYLGHCPDCPEAHYLKGRALMALERPESALGAWRQAIALDPDFLPARQALELALRRLGQLPEPSPARPLWQLDEAVEPTIVRRFGSRINTDWDEYMPFLFAADRQLGFSSTRPGGMDHVGRASLYREDFWFAEAVDGEWLDWRPALPLGAPFNTLESEGCGSMSADGRQFVFSACERAIGYGDCDLYLSYTGADGWEEPELLGAEVNSPFWDSHPALSPMADLLIFSSNRPGGYGGCDLWISRRAADGSFLPAENLGPVINSAEDEQGPFLHLDGRSLYFASRGHAGLGDLDLYYSRMDDDGKWSHPLNLGRPLNTAGADLGMVVSQQGGRAVFASRRDGFNSLDLYHTEIPACCPAEERFLLTVKVVSAITGEALEAGLRLESLSSMSPDWSRTDCHQDGLASLPLPAGPWLLFATAPGHSFASWRIDCGSDVKAASPSLNYWTLSHQPDTLLIELEALGAPVEFRLDHLDFDRDSVSIRPMGLLVIEELAAFMRQSPELEIDLHGHTDDEGSEAYNQQLSIDRAEAVKQALILRGIDAGRLSCTGFGRSMPIALGSDSLSRARNRRTEIHIRKF